MKNEMTYFDNGGGLQIETQEENFE